MRSDAEPVECPQVNGKTVYSLKIYRDQIRGTEILIDFNDGTCFSCCITNWQKIEANVMICGGPDEPELLHSFSSELENG